MHIFLYSTLLSNNFRWD